MKTLDLSSNKFGDPALLAFIHAFSRGAVPQITHLNLSHNAFTDTSFQRFARCLVTKELVDDDWQVTTVLPRLEILLLQNNHITGPGAAALAQAAGDGALLKLRALNLSGNAIGDDGVDALAKAAEDDEVLPTLTELRLCATGVGERGIATLCETIMPRTGGLPALRMLVVDDTFVQHAKLQEVYMARTGHGGVHALKISSF